MLSVALGNIGGNEILAQHAFGRTGLLDFSNHGGLPSGDFGAQGSDEIPRQDTGLGVKAHRSQGLAFGRSSDFLALHSHDLVQNITHGALPFSCWDMSTSCFS